MNEPMSAAELMAKGGQTNMLEGRKITLRDLTRMHAYQPGDDGRLTLTSPPLPRECWFRVGSEWFPGTLHMWGADYSDEGTYPIGVVEDETGKVHSMHVEMIKLCKPST